MTRRVGTKLLDLRPTVWKKMGMRANTGEDAGRGQVVLGARPKAAATCSRTKLRGQVRGLFVSHAICTYYLFYPLFEKKPSGSGPEQKLCNLSDSRNWTVH